MSMLILLSLLGLSSILGYLVGYVAGLRDGRKAWNANLRTTLLKVVDAWEIVHK